MNQNHYNILKNNNLIFFQIKNSFKKYIKKKKIVSNTTRYSCIRFFLNY